MYNFRVFMQNDLLLECVRMRQRKFQLIPEERICLWAIEMEGQGELSLLV